jgi:hypothetical protein
MLLIKLGVELQDTLQAIKKLHNAYSLPEGDLATPRIASLTPQGNMMGLLHCKTPESLRTHVRSERKGKPISPPSPPQTLLEPEKTDQTPHLPANLTRDATALEKTNPTQPFPTSETLKPRRDILVIIDADEKYP